MKFLAKQKAKKFVCLILFFLFFLTGSQALAKEVVLSSDLIDIQAGTTIDVRVNIDTGEEKINSIGFSVDFSTETLEGLIPNQSGSVFPMCATLSSTKIECGASGNNGFSGSGLATTLVFRGRKAGTSTVSISNFEGHMTREVNGRPVVDNLSGYSANSITLNVIGGGVAIPKKNTGQSQSSSDGELSAPTALSSSSTTPAQAQPTNPGSILGSLPKVPGKIGSESEEPLKYATEADVAPASAIKGIFFGKNKLYLSFFPTLLLLVLAVFLGLRLYSTEKRRHVEIERLFDRQLGMLSALESKIGLIDQKGEGGREKFIQEFEEAKVEIEAIESPEKTPKKEGGEQKSNNI